MTARQQWAVGLGVLALIGAALAIGSRFIKKDLFPATIGIEAPDFEAHAIDSAGTPRHLSDYRGQVVLLNVWATWCAPCIKEMPSIQALHDTLGSKGLKVVAVSVDDPGAVELIRQFVAHHKLTFDVLHDRLGQMQQLYQMTGYPETFIIGRDGVIRKKVTGAADWNSPANHALITQLLAGQAQ